MSPSSQKYSANMENCFLTNLYLWSFSFLFYWFWRRYRGGCIRLIRVISSYFLIDILIWTTQTWPTTSSCFTFYKLEIFHCKNHNKAHTNKNISKLAYSLMQLCSYIIPHTKNFDPRIWNSSIELLISIANTAEKLETSKHCMYKYKSKRFRIKKKEVWC